MTPDIINPWLSTILSLIAVGGFLWNHLTSGGSKALSELAKLRAEIKTEADDLERKAQIHAEAVIARFQLSEARLTKVESDMSHLPDREQSHRMEIVIERLSGRLETLDERLKPVAAISDRLQEFLLDQARK
ncbi:MAG: DUF2730 family protein [Pseudomonadota bacterium]